MDNYEEGQNIQIISRDKHVKIGIWSDDSFDKLFDIEIEINVDQSLGFTKHFEGMVYSSENEKYLRQFIDPFLINGWMKIDYRFFKVYKTEMRDFFGLEHIGPTYYYYFYSILFYIFSFGGLFSKKIEKKFEPLIKPFANKS